MPKRQARLGPNRLPLDDVITRATQHFHTVFEDTKAKAVPNRERRGGILRPLQCKPVDVASLKELGHGTCKHPSSQILKLVASLREYGLVLPVLIDQYNSIVAGRALVVAAHELGLTKIYAVRVSDLSEAKLRRLRLALNKLPEYAEWDLEALRLEFSEIIQLDPSIGLDFTGFETPQIDSILDDGGIGEEDELPPINDLAARVTQVGDQWSLGDHVIRCANALEIPSFAHLLGSVQARMVFTDPPYNVKIAGNVTQSTSSREHDFTMAMGELSCEEFQIFLDTSLSLAARFSMDGAIHYICMDWRHIFELLLVGKRVYTELKNICVWNKSNAGMGSLYRSQHELVAVYKVGSAAHINNVELGRHGRNRSNVWNYIGQNALNGTRKSKLSLHPTVKPVAMIADAIRDCSNRGDVILDCFGGAGTTLIAAEKTGRRARILELNPIYIDVTITRWQRLTGKVAYHMETGQPFSPVDDQTH
jgi:DNA modification methylase